MHVCECDVDGQVPVAEHTAEWMYDVRCSNGCTMYDVRCTLRFCQFVIVCPKVKRAIIFDGRTLYRKSFTFTHGPVDRKYTFYVDR